MPKRKKQKTNVVAENIAGSKTARGEPSGRRAWFVISAVIIVLVLLTGGIVYYQVSAAPFQQPVVTVDNAVIRMDYFLNRTRMAGSNPGSVLQQLVDEQLVHERANWDPTPIPQLPMTLHVNTWPSRSRELAGRLAGRRLPATAVVRSIAVEASVASS